MATVTITPSLARETDDLCNMLSATMAAFRNQIAGASADRDNAHRAYVGALNTLTNHERDTFAKADNAESRITAFREYETLKANVRQLAGELRETRKAVKAAERAARNARKVIAGVARGYSVSDIRWVIQILDNEREVRRAERAQSRVQAKWGTIVYSMYRTN